MRPSVFCLVAAVFTSSALDVQAEDRVVIQIPTRSSRMPPMSCMVIDYTGEMLTVRSGPMAEIQQIPLRDVVSVETDYLESHTRGRDLFAQGKIREAEAQFLTALEDEERPWVRRELLAALVRCALYEDDLRRAALRFVSIVESDPRTMYWGLIPLVWDPEAVAAPTDADARTVQATGSAVARLIVASWNLERNGRRSPDAETTLQTLAADADPFIQRLSQMQLWRVRLATQAVTTNELRRWESQADDLPLSLRAGAHALLGRGAMQQKDALRAAAEWMWLPLHHADHRGLAAWGQVRSAEAMLAAGDPAGSQLLAREVIQRFPGTISAMKAKTLLRMPSGNAE